MTRRSVLVIGAAAAALAACGSTSAVQPGVSTSPAATNPCALLTQADVASTLGVAVAAPRLVPGRPAYCVFNGPDVSLELFAGNGQTAGNFAALTRQPGARRIADLGDDAYALVFPNGQMRIEVLRGTVDLTLQATSRPNAGVDLARLQALAEVAARRA